MLLLSFNFLFLAADLNFEAACVSRLLLATDRRFARISSPVLIIRSRDEVGFEENLLAQLNENIFRSVIIKDTGRAPCGHGWNQLTLKKSRSYLFLIHSADQLEGQLKVLRATLTYTTRVKVTVFLKSATTKLEEIFKFFLENNFFEISVIVPQGEVITSYSYKPFHRKNCIWTHFNVELEATCYKNSTLTLAKIKRGLAVKNCSINVAASVFEPYVVMNQTTGKIERGLEVRLIQTVFNRLNVKVKFQPVHSTERYEHLSNQTGIYANLLNK